jgi:UDP-N-acetylglucosamine--dolichyl-phosphate N-acetylglucosaminephosphotransferase
MTHEEFMISAAFFFVSLLVSCWCVPIFNRRLRRAGIVGRDLHKPGQPEISEMGGLAGVAGFASGLLLAAAVMSFFHLFRSVDLVVLLAALSTILMAGLIGMVDDLLGMRQWVKAFLPAVAALPLMAVRAGHTSLMVPFVGQVNFWIFYPLFLIPAAVTVAANAVNMLAGFNGLELGMGLVAMASLAALAGILHQPLAFVILLSGLGALLGMIHYNWYPARILVGDVATLSIGAILATGVIVGNFETAGVIVLIPYAVDFLFKAAHGFPSRGWSGELCSDGKLRCPARGPVGLGQFILKLTGGLHERTLVIVLMGIEAIFGTLAVLLYIL